MAFIERIENSFGEIIYQADPLWACEPCQEDFEKPPAPYLELSDKRPTTPLGNDKVINSELDTMLLSYSTAAENQNTVLKRQAPRVITEQNAFLVTQALNSVIWGADWNTQPHWQGTGFRARTLERRDIAGKTGTTNLSKDAWFSGFSRRLATTSWIGFDDHKRNLGKSSRNSNGEKDQITGTEFGAKSAQPPWIDYMKVALSSLDIEPFLPPEGIVSVRIDKTTGKLTRSVSKHTQFEFFRVENVPTEYVSEAASRSVQESTKDIFDDELF